ncbi:hypothetical protein [Streptomyces sp. NPDC001315]|uniref:hypothetical protein n=1 Tax=Streptomyces sp. NPDC001315 TaxID=3364562 RepID=UPI0036AB17E4
MYLQTVDADGGIQEVIIQIGKPSTAMVELLDDQFRTAFRGTDYLDCLTQVRKQLEHKGRLLCCQGARPNVHPSGQLRQFTNGRQAYVLPSGTHDEAHTTVDIFAPVLPGNVVSLDDQRISVISYWNARHPRNQI